MPGYTTLEKIDEGSFASVYRAVDEQHKPVMITIFRDEGILKNLIMLENGFETAGRLDIPGIIRPLELKVFDDSVILISEGFDGRPLKEIIATRHFPVTDFLKIAVRISGILQNIHSKKIIHGGIRPSNIFVNWESFEAKINPDILSISPAPYAAASEFFEDALPYISPEKTGRINCSIDFRADLYSLGIVFFEMLAGRPPFKAEDPLELIHCHIAMAPQPLSELRGDIPLPVSKIVMKLLAKEPGNRYKTARKVLDDINMCLNQLKATGRIECFEPGLETGRELFLCDRLYGRGKEMAMLRDGLHRASLGSVEIMLITGPMGVGKTSLANEIRRFDGSQFVISGKFDEFYSHVPYSAITTALQELTRRLLCEDEKTMRIWAEKILKAIGPNGSVLIDIMPQLEKLIGKQPPVPKIGPIETQNRFNLVFEQFVGIFSQKEHPLVMFLDDLQWADPSSLRLIQSMLARPGGCLLIVGAYRDDEVDSSHPLTSAIEKIKADKIAVKKIPLSPLSLEDIRQLVADIFGCDEEERTSVANLISNNTRGNPLFVNQVLRQVIEESSGLSISSADALYAAILQTDIGKTTAGVSVFTVEAMAKRIGKLPEDTQQILKLASCLRDSFDLKSLSGINGKTPEETANALYAPVTKGIIMPIETVIPNSQCYKFSHDWHREAIYSMIPEDQKKSIHMEIARFLLKTEGKDAHGARFFDIVNHINAGIKPDTRQDDRDEYAGLNLEAGLKAKKSAAYEAALDYFRAGAELLSEGFWDREYGLTLSLFMESAISEYLCGKSGDAARRFDSIIEHSNTRHDAATAYIAKMDMHILGDRYTDAIEEGIRGLGLFHMDTDFRNANSAAELGSLIHLAKEKGISSLADMPDMASEDDMDAVRILSNITMPAHAVSQDLFLWVVARQIDLILRRGICDAAPTAFSFFGIIAGSGFGDYDAGYELGRLALDLNRRFNVASLKCRLNHIFAITSNCWKSHAKASIPYLEKAVEEGLANGDLTWASYAATNIVNYMFIKGDSLGSVGIEALRRLALAKKGNITSNIQYLKMMLQVVKNLKGQTAGQDNLSDGSFDEEAFERDMRKCQVRIGGHLYYLCKLQTLYIAGYYESALKAAAECVSFEDASFSLIQVPEQYFYHSLVLAGLYDAAGEAEKTEYRKILDEKQKKMKIWADNCPDNFLHKFLLISAEMARISGNVLEAMSLYEGAIKSAKEAGYAQNEAIANELAARFYFSCGLTSAAMAHITAAYKNYLRWGATAKATRLAEMHPELSIAASAKPGADMPAIAGTLDLKAIIKASQLISGEIALEKLLKKIMSVVIENAGAGRGILMLLKEGSLLIEAEAFADKGRTEVMQSSAFESPYYAPISIINYVRHTAESVVLGNAVMDKVFGSDPYIVANHSKSILCLPVLRHGSLTGVLYLENNLAASAFTPEMIEVLEILISQAAISLENARLFEEQIAAEKEKTNLKAQLFHAQKMEAIGQLAGGVAHEINNPINAIINFAQLIIDENPSGNPGHEYGERIVKIGNRIAAIVKNLLAFSRSIEGEKEDTDIKEIIEECLLLAEAGFRKDFITVAVDLHEDLPMVRAHKYQIEQVFLNVLGNSQYALNQKYPGQNENKIIRITGEKIMAKDRPFVRLVFHDQGTGMPQDIIEKAMDPFFTTKPAGSGTGLGLSISYGIIADHGGRLDIESGEDEGGWTDVIIDLPASEKQGEILF